MFHRRTRILARGVALSLGWLAAGSTSLAVQEAARTFNLDQGSELLAARGTTHSRSSGLRHVYRIALKTGELLAVAVEQRGLDIILQLVDPAGTPLLSVDSRNENMGVEPLLWVAEKPGTYRLVVDLPEKSAPNANYVVQRVERKHASSGDRMEAAGLQSYYRARSLVWHHAKPSEVIAALLAATRLLDRYGPLEVRANGWADLGETYYGQNDWPRAADAYRRAAPLFGRLGRRKQEAQSLNQLAQSELRILKVESARRHFEQALAPAEAAHDPLMQAKILYNLGLFYAERVDAWNAIRYAERSLLIAKRLGVADSQAQALIVLGMLHSRMGMTEKALEEYESGLRLPVKDPIRASLLTQMGHALVYGGRPDRALPSYRQAFEINRRSGTDPDVEAGTLVGLGLAYVTLEHLSDALDPYRRALRAYRAKRDPRGEAITLLNLGWALGGLSRYEEAKDSFTRALNLIRLLKNPRLEAGVLLGSAWIERRQGHLDQAQRLAEKAKLLVETLRSGTGEADLRVAFFSSIQDVYDLLIGILMDRYKLEGSPALMEKALEISESARARNLLDNLGVKESPGGDQHSKAADIALHVLTAREIQQLLDPDTVLLEYFLGKPKSYLWFVTQREIQAFELPGQVTVEGLAQKAHERLTKSHLGEGQAAVQTTQELSRLLLGPVADRLGSKRLLIVTSGALQSIPFGALPDPVVARSRTDPERPWPGPLLAHHEVVQEPSASVLARIRRSRAQRPPASKLLAALADAVFERDDPRLARFAGERQGGSDPLLGRLRRLPSSREEAEAITKGLPPRQILKALDFDANRDLVTSGKLRDFRMIHLASHTFYQLQNPDLTAIVLSRYDSQGRAREGRLRIADVSGLEFRADVVVLSSCNSAFGKNIRGEGRMGLPQAFLSAGASSVVTTAWDIGDQSAAELMRLFYRNVLDRGMTPSAGLREAQIALWTQPRRNAPWYWAGFMMQGEWKTDPFSLNKFPPTVSSLDGDPRSHKMTRRPSPQ